MIIFCVVFCCGHATLKEALSVNWSVGPLVRPSRLSCHAWVENAKNAYVWCSSWYCLSVSMMEGCWGCDRGGNGGWMPLPTRPQRYFDPASLVLVLMWFWFVVLFSCSFVLSCCGFTLCFVFVAVFSLDNVPIIVLCCSVISLSFWDCVVVLRCSCCSVFRYCYVFVVLVSAVVKMCWLLCFAFSVNVGIDVLCSFALSCCVFLFCMLLLLLCVVIIVLFCVFCCYWLVMLVVGAVLWCSALFTFYRCHSKRIHKPNI